MRTLGGAAMIIDAGHGSVPPEVNIARLQLLDRVVNR